MSNKKKIKTCMALQEGYKILTIRKNNSFCIKVHKMNIKSLFSYK